MAAFILSTFPPSAFATRPILSRRTLKVMHSRRQSSTAMVSEQGAGDQGAGSKTKTRAELAALYGGAYLGTSIALSTVSFIMWYAAVSVGVNVPQLLDALGNWLETTPLGRPSALDGVSGEVGAFALAYIAHKVTSPFRFPLTVAATPVVARMVGKGRAKQDENNEDTKDNTGKKT